MLRIRLGRSTALAALLAALHGVALLLALTVEMPFWAKCLFGLLIVASAAHAILLHAWQALPHAIVGLEMSEDCRAWIIDRADVAHPAALLPSSVVTPWLTVLNLREQGKRWPRALVIVPDRVDADLYRRLRVWLRWRCGRGAVEETPLR